MPGGLLQIANSAGDARRHPATAGRRAELSLRSAAASRPLSRTSRKFARSVKFGNVRVALDPLPAHRLELLAEGLLDEIVFPLDLHESN